MGHAHCYDCGLRYGGDSWVEAIIPDKIWNKIKPKGCGDGAGLLCISCIARRLSILGYEDVPVFLCGTEPLRAVEGDPADNLSLLRNYP